MATNLTSLANAGVTAPPMRTVTASATTLTLVLGNSMPVACATAQERFTNAAAPTSQRATAIAMATSLTPWAFAVDPARPTTMETASATRMKPWGAPTHQLATTTRTQPLTTEAAPSLTSAACAEVLGQCTNAAALTSQKAIATAMATKTTPSACVADPALKTSTTTTSATQTSRVALTQPTPITTRMRRLTMARASWVVAPSNSRATTTPTRTSSFRVLATSRRARVAQILLPATTTKKPPWTMACVTSLISRTTATATA